MNDKKAKGCLIFLVAGIGLSWGVYKCNYAYSYWSDLNNRPWAYSGDENAKLLVGEWEGTFHDPDGISKNIRIRIFEPTPHEERKAQAGKRKRNRKGIRSKDKRSFEGSGTVCSQLGTERYEIYGSVEKENFHNLSFRFSPENEAKRVLPNFTLLQAESGNWIDDRLTVTLSFGYNRADGSSFFSSADLRHDKKVILHLNRKLK